MVTGIGVRLVVECVVFVGAGRCVVVVFSVVVLNTGCFAVVAGVVVLFGRGRIVVVGGAFVVLNEVPFVRKKLFFSMPCLFNISSINSCNSSSVSAWTVNTSTANTANNQVLFIIFFNLLSQNRQCSRSLRYLDILCALACT